MFKHKLTNTNYTHKLKIDYNLSGFDENLNGHPLSTQQIISDTKHNWTTHLTDDLCQLHISSIHPLREQSSS
jgi:hypothetical protein